MKAGPGLLALAGLLAGVASARPPDPPDVDDAQAARLTARRALAENCLICHGPDLIASQRLTASQWKASVEKMVGWGAPVPPELQQPLVDYLHAEYPSTRPAPTLARMSIDEAERSVRPQPAPAPEPPGAPIGSAERGEPLYVRHCANCHGADGQGAELGSNLVEKPVLGRPADFATIVRDGSGRMPAFQTLLDGQANADLIAWLRARTYRPPAAK